MKPELGKGYVYSSSLTVLEAERNSAGQELDEVEQSLEASPFTIYNLPDAPFSPPRPAAPTDEDIIPDCPYRGLFAFRPEHAPFFFGRETFTAKLVQATEGRPFVAVLGASGSGKSSVVFAGLVPALDRSDDQWLLTTFRPGDDPFLGLANALVPFLEPDLNKINRSTKPVI